MTVILTHGCFDVIHIGHLRLLKAAKAMGDELVVSVLADKYVAAVKPGRPVHCLNVRLEHLQALRFVDRIAIVDGAGHAAVERMIAEIAPAIYVKGSEFRGRLLEQAFAESIGVRVEFFEMQRRGAETSSSTRLIKEFAE